MSHPGRSWGRLTNKSGRGTYQSSQGAKLERGVQSESYPIDVVDNGHPALLRMWEKRQLGYRAMGYKIGSDVASCHQGKDKLGHHLSDAPCVKGDTYIRIDDLSLMGL